MNRYERKIVGKLLKKFSDRKIKYPNVEINRRISLTINKVLSNYSDYNVDLSEKELVNQAISTLEKKGFITTSKLKYSEDFQTIYLNLKNIHLLEEYAAKNLEIVPRSFAAENLLQVIQKYKEKGEVVEYYVKELMDSIHNRSILLDVNKEEDILKILVFVENNKDFLYIREASMLIFGDSKYLENKRKSQINAILYNYFKSSNEYIIEEENLLERFNIYDTDQDICIKGPVVIELDNKVIDINGLSGGVSFSIKDIGKINRITVHCPRIMTIENKTSFLRMNALEDCYIYLGGFATRPQISFIKLLFNDNPNKEYLHFGDIDAGGFWIHKKLCEQSSIPFKLFCMNKEILNNNRYKVFLKSLSDSDIHRLTILKNIPQYTKCINWMLDNNCKMEQEIISLFLDKSN